MGFFLSYSPLLIAKSDLETRKECFNRIGEATKIGWTFDVARFHHEDTAIRSKLEAFPRAQVLFNFVGREIGSLEDTILEVSNDYRGIETDPKGKRDHLLAVLAIIKNERLVVRFVYSQNFHTDLAIEKLSQLFLVNLEQLSD